jgi:hypothetical protein
VAVDIQKVIDALVSIQRTTTDGNVKERMGPLIDNLNAYVKDESALTDGLKSQLATLQQANDGLQKDNTVLRQQLTKFEGVTSASPLNLAAAFKNVVDAIQAGARGSAGVGTTIKALDIEVKSMVQVQDDKTTVLLLPSIGTQVRPESLSTMRVSFGAIPVASTPPAGTGAHHPDPEPPAHIPPASKPSTGD